MTVLLIQSHFGPAPQGYAVDPHVLVVRERDLTARHFAGAAGLITTTHLEHVGLLLHRPALQDILNSGGRRFFNGHILRRFVDGLGLYVPLDQPNRADLAMKRLSEHPIFAGKKQRSLAETRASPDFTVAGTTRCPKTRWPSTASVPSCCPLTGTGRCPGADGCFLVLAMIWGVKAATAPC